jgi:phosphatidylserine/phosphatidylglycerophosphate/cardiolipin synthase-like enzyme
MGTYRHDVGLQVVGQPARDLARHFIQRFADTSFLRSLDVG